jgi:hypothetical protein
VLFALNNVFTRIRINWISRERRFPREQTYGDDKHFPFLFYPLACAALL